MILYFHVTIIECLRKRFFYLIISYQFLLEAHHNIIIILLPIVFNSTSFCIKQFNILIYFYFLSLLLLHLLLYVQSLGKSMKARGRK